MCDKQMRGLDVVVVDLVIQRSMDNEHRLFCRQSCGTLAGSPPVGVNELGCSFAVLHPPHGCLI